MRDTELHRQLEYHQLSAATKRESGSVGARGEPHGSMCCSERSSQKGGGRAEVPG